MARALESLSDEELAAAYVRALSRAKTAYGRADEAIAELHSRRQPGDKIDSGIKGQTIQLVDNFAESNVSWKPAGVKRLDAKVIKPPRQRKKAAKKKSSKKKSSKKK